ncbi:MAG: type V CRISPR-associated protein Cas4 [Patescibacteria group bacterium]|nr:type V CRISPR-associated protein Cas4 [Patescibacteria group bacterium]
MYSYIPISKINDFLYCPKTLYLHMMYEDFSDDLFHDEPQRKGRIKHQSIEEKNYSTSNRFLVGKEVYSDKYRIMGKIDIYDKEEKTLIERKTKVKCIYDGYKYQLYAQYFCLLEMGYEVKKIIIRSMSDNKNYFIPLPSNKDKNIFEDILKRIRNFNPLQLINHSCPRCQNSIYSTLNW